MTAPDPETSAAPSPAAPPPVTILDHTEAVAHAKAMRRRASDTKPPDRPALGAFRPAMPRLPRHLPWDER